MAPLIELGLYPRCGMEEKITKKKRKKEGTEATSQLVLIMTLGLSCGSPGQNHENQH